MGTDKALVMLRGTPLVMRVVERLRLLPIDELFMISRQADQYHVLDISVYPDIVPDLGPIGGLSTALKLTHHDYIIVVGCDMPFINPALLMKLLEAQNETQYDAIVPRWCGKSQPLHAVYHRNSLPKIEAALTAGTRRLQDLLDQLHTRWMDEDEYASMEAEGLAFTNLNTPADLERAATYLTEAR